MAKHIDGLLHSERLGKYGRPMVFVHPNPMDHSCWTYQMAHFSTWFTTLGIDLPGYGRSPTARPGLSMEDLANACWEAVDEVADEAAVLVGLSVGAKVVLYMANRRPDRTLAVIVSGSGYHPGVKEYVPKRIAQYQEQGVTFRRQHTLEVFSPTFRTSQLGQYFATLFAERDDYADAPTIVEVFRALGEPDPDWLFEGVKAPTLIITGSEDPGHQRAFPLQQHLAGSELVTIEGAGHACNMEQPWEWDRHALAFLAARGLVGAPAAVRPATVP